MTPIKISIPHQLGRAEARRRLEAGFANIAQLFPASSGSARSERWDGDQLSFDIAAMGQSVSGVVNVLEAAVTMEIYLPGAVGIIASGLKCRLHKMGQLLLAKD